MGRVQLCRGDAFWNCCDIMWLLECSVNNMNNLNNYVVYIIELKLLTTMGKYKISRNIDRIIYIK